MRAKQLRFIVTFHTTAGAIAMEKMCKNQGLAGRLIPVPREISAGCGMAWSAPPEEQQRIRAAAENAGLDVEAFYEIIV